MILQKRIERAFSHLHGKSAEKAAPSYDRESNGDLPIEKGDMAAMIISALIVILPVALAVLLIMVLVGALWIL